MPLRSTNTFPPGGFRYVQKETKFSPQPMMPFGAVVQEVLAHRVGNRLSRATKEEVAEDIHEFNCARLGNDPHYCISTVKKKLFPGSNLSESQSHRRVAKLVGQNASAVLSGIQILKDWVGDGMKPVPDSEAQGRADACTGRTDGMPCPNNQEGSVFLSGIAKAVREQMDKKREMNVSIQGEENLKSCSVCLCHLPLKVHVPIETILERTPDSMIEKFRVMAPAKCWMLQAINKKNPQ